MKRGTAVVAASVECVAMVETAATIEIGMVEIVAIDDRSAVGDVGVVIVDHSMAMPVASPVMPAPTIPSEKTNPKADSKSNPHSTQEDPWHGIPTWVCDDRVAVHEPWIVGGHIDHLRVGRFDDDRVVLSRYLLLFVGIQVAGFASLLTHHLDGVRHILLLIGIRIAER